MPVDGTPAPRLHVLHVLLSLEPGGLENGVVNVVNGLDPRRFRSSVVCLKSAGEFARRITDPAVRIHEMGWRGGADVKLPLRLARLFRATRPHVVHTRNAESFFYGFAGAKLARVPRLVHSEHGRRFDDRAVRFTVQRLMTRWTDAVFTVSEQLKHDLVRHVGMPPGVVQVLHNGVDFDRFDHAAERPREDALRLRDALRIPADAMVVGSVGRLVPVKNYALLVRAVAAGPADVQLVLAGDGPERGALEALARALDIAPRVHLIGHRDDIDRVLPAFDMFVLPSLSEGMSNTLLEAMACGVPVVASDVGGNREIVRQGVDGFLFASGDEAALAGHLARLQADPGLRERVGRVAREHVCTNFDLRAMVARYERLYERVHGAAAA